MGKVAKLKRATDQVVRFGVGSADRPESFVWRCFVRASDVYVGAREMLQFVKVSFHQSGVWRVAFVATLDRPDRETDRVMIRWQRPAAAASGLTAAAHLFVTAVEPQQL